MEINKETGTITNEVKKSAKAEAASILDDELVELFIDVEATQTVIGHLREYYFGREDVAEVEDRIIYEYKTVSNFMHIALDYISRISEQLQTILELQ